MDPIIAEMFNTNGYAEKVAQVEENVAVFLKVAEDEGIDLSGLDDDEIVQMANEMVDEYGDDEFEYGYSEGPDNLGPKTAEAEWLGRYMAHAMWDEQEKIAETEMQKRIMGGISGGKSKEPTMTEVLKNRKLQKDHGIKGQVYGRRDSIKGVDTGIKKRHRAEMKARTAAGRGMRGLESVGERILGNKRPSGATSSSKKVTKYLRGRRAAGAGAIGLGTAALGATGYGAYKALSKKSHLDLLDESAEKLALDALAYAEAGEHVTFDKLASSYVDDDFDLTVAELAWSKLQEAGYVE